MSSITGKRILIFVEQQYNEFELWYPKYRLLEAGAKPLLAGPRAGDAYPSKVGLPAVADIAFQDVDPDTVDGLIVPGGFAPDFMRRSPHCIDLTRKIHSQNKPLAWICHGGWVPVSADIVRGRKVTSFFSIKDDLIHAGGLWEDSEVVVDGNLVSSRAPDDLPAFMTAFMKLF
jgi:protease I